MNKLGLSKRILLQEYPSLEMLARLTTGRRPLVTLVNIEPDVLIKTVCESSEVRKVSMLGNDDLDRLREAANLVSYFRHYCFAKNLVELGYSDIDERVLEMIILEFPLYNVEYCKDEVRYVVEKLKKKSSKLLDLLIRYPICDKTSPLNVLAYTILDLNLVGVRSVINEFFINFNQDPENQVLRLITAHMVYVFLPAVSQGSLIVTDNSISKLLQEFSPSNLIEFQVKDIDIGVDVDTAVRQYRTVLTRVLNMLDKTVDMFELPKVMDNLMLLDKRILREYNEVSEVRYMILMLTPPKTRSSYHIPTRYISNIGLLVRYIKK